MNCSACGSDDTRRFSVVHDQGKIGSSAGDIQTAQAARCAPPEMKSAFAVFRGTFLLYVFGAIALFIVVAIVDDELLGGTIWSLFGGEPNAGRNLAIAHSLLIVAGIVLAFRGAAKQAAFNRAQYPQMRQRWEQSWLCMRCGKTSVE